MRTPMVTGVRANARCRVPRSFLEHALCVHFSSPFLVGITITVHAHVSLEDIVICVNWVSQLLSRVAPLIRFDAYKLIFRRGG